MLNSFDTLEQYNCNNEEIKRNNIPRLTKFPGKRKLF